MLSRRDMLKILGVSAICSAGLPLSLSYAKTPNDKRLLVVILRGGMDGLAALIPHGDKHYTDARGDMAMPLNDKALIPLNDTFALHQALKPMADYYRKGQLVLLPASATPYRKRSHFDAQDVLENGSTHPWGVKSGWLNRAIALLSDSPEAIAVGAGLPLIMRGDYRVGSWSPPILPEVDESLLARIEHMYATDDALLSAFEAAQSMNNMGIQKDSEQKRINFSDMMEKTASFMLPQTGARIATIELPQWDTHANQGLEKGVLANKFKMLADGLKAYEKAIGKRWNDTAVVMLSEFGRTVKGNGTKGTDHGTGGLCILAGGAVKGGQIVGDWPGLGKLHEGRDLAPANDIRLFLKALMHQHLGLDEVLLSEVVFPGTQNQHFSEKIIS